MKTFKVWYIYVESKERAGWFMYFAETTLGEAEAMLTAADLANRGSRAMIADKRIGDGYHLQAFDTVKV